MREMKTIDSIRFNTAVTPVTEGLLQGDAIFKQQKVNLCARFCGFLGNQFSLRNIILALLAIFLIGIALAVWGLSYAGSTASIEYLLSKVRASTSSNVASNLLNLFQSAEIMTQEIVEYCWADKNELQMNLTTTDKTNFVHFMYSILKPNYLIANSINFIKSDGSLLAVTYAPGVSTGWRTTQSFPDTGSYRAYFNVSSNVFSTLAPTLSPFVNYTKVIASYAYITSLPSVPETGIMMNVSLDTTGSGNILTSSVRMLRSRTTGEVLGVVNAVFYISTIKNLLVLANPSRAGFIVLMQDDLTLVADSVQESVIYGVTPCASNATQVKLLCDLINSRGGVQKFGTGEAKMDIPGIGIVSVVLQTVRRGNINWNIFIALPDSEYYGTVVQYSFNTIYMCLALIFVAIVASGGTLFFILRTLNRISTCFRQVQQLNLDSSIIKQTVKRKSWVYEVRSLQHNFKAMLFTLKSFQKFIPRELVKQLVISNEEAKLGLDRKICTVFFMDVSGFTTISEVLEPETLVGMMGELFGECSKIIVQNKGNIDKYVGDCIMAFWGAPQECPHQETWGVIAAIKVQRFVRDFAKVLDEEGLPPIKVRIGLNTGPVLVGYFGSNERLSYTVMGDPVNLASRLEGLNKYYDTSILISSATYEGWQKTIQETKLMFESPFDFEDIDPSNIPCRRMEKAKVKGKNVSNLVYEILPFEQYDDRKDDFALYEQGYDLFLAGRFQDALGIFTIVKQNQKEGLVDNVVQKKIEMCEAFAKEPPAEWDGSLRMEEK